MDEARLREIAKLGDKHPKNFDMHDVIYTTGCRTVGCFIGWETLLHAFGTFAKAKKIDIETAALQFHEGDSQDRLGMPNQRLFFTTEWPKDIHEKWRRKKATLLDVVENYIETNGWKGIE